MTKLTKVVLINWMYFQKATINLNGNTALVGINGSGKSTLIDAVQMLLLGNRASKFNANANAEKRTLESYVRGSVNMDGKENLRPGDVVTYLALELISNGTKHVFGLTIDYKFSLSKLSDPKYFYVKNLDLSEDVFIQDNFPKTYDILSREFKKNYEYVSFATLFNYQTKLKDVLGLKDEKAYFKTLSRAVGIKNITDCNTFMNEFVLDENPIDVSSIKNNIIEMEKVSKTIENEQKKLDALNEIADLGSSIEEESKTLLRNNVKKNVASIRFNEQEISKLNEKNNQLESFVNDELSKKKNLENYLEELKENVRSLNKSLDSVSPDLPRLKQELVMKQAEYSNVHATLNTLKTKCENEFANLSVLSKFNDSVMDDFYKYLENGNFTTETIKKKFMDFRTAVMNLSDTYNTKKIGLENEIDALKDPLEELAGIINKLQNNQRSYDRRLVDFLDYIRSGLKSKYNQDVEVNFLCEYLDITDETWRKAIEGYLGNQRFYLVVPNEYYKEALRLYHEKQDFYMTRIINGTRLPEYDLEEGTLGEFVEASNTIALNYARYLLNRVHCAKDIYELDHYDIAVTKDCMLYQGYTAGRINPRLCEEQYIGMEGIRNQLKMRLEQKKQLSDQAMDLKGKQQKYNGYCVTLNNELAFATKIIENNSYFDSVDKDSNLFDSVNKLEETIKFYESNPKYIEITAKIADTEKEIFVDKNLISKSDDLITEYKSSIKANEREIDIFRENSEYFSGLLMNVNEEILASVNDELKSAVITKTYIAKLESDTKALDKQVIKNKSDLENLMRNARNDFNINAEPAYESLPRFKEEKNKIDQSVFKYQAKLVEFKKQNRNLFFSQFLTKLYRSVDAARKTIDNLNYSLKVFDFGKDYYTIKMGVTENKDFQTIYEYAKEYNSDDSNRGLLIDYEKEDRDRNKIMDLLNQYMFSDDPKLQDCIVDYRKYLYFDVEVHTPNGVKKLNEVMKTQSGGEVQVPFYILSGVAFQQTLDYKRNKDALGIVLYDEAFDKMDSQRIQSMLQFYRDRLNLQIVLAAPGKLDSLADNIETMVAVIRDGDNAIVSDISHEL